MLTNINEMFFGRQVSSTGRRSSCRVKPLKTHFQCLRAHPSVKRIDNKIYPGVFHGSFGRKNSLGYYQAHGLQLTRKSS